MKATNQFDHLINMMPKNQSKEEWFKFFNEIKTATLKQVNDTLDKMDVFISADDRSGRVVNRKTGKYYTLTETKPTGSFTSNSNDAKKLSGPGYFQ